MSRLSRLVVCSLVVPGLLQLSVTTAAAQPSTSTRSGREVYETVCIMCHGPNGRGGVNLDVKPPDFADCAFAAREPDRGFLAVAHHGGPARGFVIVYLLWDWYEGGFFRGW